jgi:hypothetical protein
MVAECRYNSGKNIKNYRFRGETDNSVYDLTITKQYKIFGICIYEDIISYLVSDDSELPNWYSALCFKIINNQLPKEWFYKEFIEDNTLLKAIWGYKLLVDDKKHYIGLLEREKEDIDYFRKVITE